MSGRKLFILKCIIESCFSGVRRNAWSKGWRHMISGVQKALISGWYPWYPADGFHQNMAVFSKFSSLLLFDCSPLVSDPISRWNQQIFLVFCLTPNRPAMPFGNWKIYFRGSFHFSIVTIKKYHPSGNLKFNNLSVFQSLKLHIFTGEKIFRFLFGWISLQFFWAVMG